VTSTNGSTRLAMQTDGNLVLYNGAGQASLSVWHVHAQAPQRSCMPTEISSSTAGPEHRPGPLGCTAPAHTSSFRTTGTPALKFDRDSAVGRVGIYGELWGASHLTPTHPQVISHGVAQHPAGPFGKNQPTPRLPRTTRLRRTQGERGRATRPWQSPLCNRREPAQPMSGSADGLLGSTVRPTPEACRCSTAVRTCPHSVRLRQAPPQTRLGGVLHLRRSDPVTHRRHGVTDP